MRGAATQPPQMSTAPTVRSDEIGAETNTLVRVAIANGDHDYVVVQFETDHKPATHSELQERVRVMWNELPVREFRTLAGRIVADWPGAVKGICGGVLRHDPANETWHCEHCNVYLPPGVWAGHVEGCYRSQW